MDADASIKDGPAPARREVTRAMKVTIAVFLVVWFGIIALIARMVMEYEPVRWPLALAVSGLVMWALVSSSRRRA
jgi:hypothetical protein